MKRNLLLLLVATMFAACMTDDTNQVDWSGDVPINISVKQSRANDSTFERGDQIGLYVVNSKNSTLFSSGNYVDNMCFELANDWTPSQTIYWIDQTTKLDMYAYYPYGNPTNVTAYPFSVLSDQSSESKYFASDFLWGKRTNVVPTTDKVAIATEHLFSNALVYIVAGEGVTAEELAASNIEVKVCNVKLDAKINLATGAVEAIGETGDITPWYTGSYYRAMIVPQSVSSSKELVNITVGGEEYTYSTDMTFECGTRHKVTVTISRPTTPDTPSNELSVNFTIEEWKDDNIDHGGDAVKKEEVATQKDFAVTFSNKTPLSADATISILDATKQDMVWGAFTFGESALEVEDWNTGQVSTKTPEEFAAEQLALFADPMGYGGLGFGFYYMVQSMSGLLSNMNGNVLNCSLYNWRGAEKKMYLVVVGLNWGLNMETGEDATTQATAVNVFEVETIPQPKVDIKTLTNVVEATAGTLTLNAKVENPYGSGVVSVTTDSNWVTATLSNETLTISYEANPYAKTRTANVTVTYTYKCSITQYGETTEVEVPATTTVKVEQKANPDVKPLTFTINVKETHYDRIVADIVPSDANAYYCVGTESQSTYNDYTQWHANAWDAVCEYALGTPHQGTLTDYVFEINTQYATTPEEWTYYVFAFATDAEGTVVAGEPTYKETQVTNDTPTVTFDLDYEVASGLKVTYNEDTGNYELNTPAEGGTFTVKYAFANAPEGAVLRINNSTSDVVSDTYDVLGGDPDATPVFDDENCTMTVVVNPYDSSKTEWYQHYVTIYVRMYTSADKTQSVGQTIHLRINQTQLSNQ